MSTETTNRHQVAAEADAILLSVRQTDYTHHTHVDVTAGRYDMDCSAYVGYVLQRIAPQHYGTIHNGGGSHGPLAVDFYHRFHALPPAAPTAGGLFSPSPTHAAATSWPGSSPAPGRAITPDTSSSSSMTPRSSTTTWWPSGSMTPATSFTTTTPGGKAAIPPPPAWDPG